ncbi:MAG: helix-turn-helix domain-containing protein [Oscillospiraceae bacterium]|nr:helix-turn-helix domain-containing protein [Oscillospiraceae bacterium]
MVDFGARLKQLRIEKGLSQPQLAERISVTKSVISAYENEIRMPSYDILIKLATLFSVSTDFLLGMNNEKYLYTNRLTNPQTIIISRLIEEFTNKNEK